MKFFHKFVIWFFVFVVFVMLFLYVAVQSNGKGILETNLSAAVKRPVTVESVRFIFPLGIRADGLNIEGFLTADVMRAHFGISGLLGQGMIFSKVLLEQPHLKVIKGSDGNWQLGEPVVYDISAQKETKVFLFFKAPEKKEQPAEQSPEEAKQLTAGVLIENLWIDNGILDFTDRSRKSPLNLKLEELNIRAFSVAYPLRPYNTRYNLTARVVSEQLPYSGSQLESGGWVNWVDRGMDAKVKLTEPNGSVGVDVDLKSKNNALEGSGRFKLSHLMSTQSRDAKPAEGAAQNSFEEIFMTALNSSGLQARAECSFQTQMDNFHLDKLSCKGKIGINQGGLKENLQEIGKKFEALGKQISEKKEPEAVPAPAVPEGEKNLAE